MRRKYTAVIAGLRFVQKTGKDGCQRQRRQSCSTAIQRPWSTSGELDGVRKELGKGQGRYEKKRALTYFWVVEGVCCKAVCRGEVCFAIDGPSLYPMGGAGWAQDGCNARLKRQIFTSLRGSPCCYRILIGARTSFMPGLMLGDTRDLEEIRPAALSYRAARGRSIIRICLRAESIRPYTSSL